MPTFSKPIFTSNAANHSYLFDRSEFKTEFKSNESLILPLAHDSEYQNNVLQQFLDGIDIENRCHISTQIKHIFDKPVFFLTPNAQKDTGFSMPVMQDFVVCDYLKILGVNSFIEIENDENILKEHPKLDLYLYSFFGIVDIPLLAPKDSIIYETIKLGLAQNSIRHDKRLNTDWSKPVATSLVMYIEDTSGNFQTYHLRFYFIDLAAIHGNKGYKGVCENVGIDVSKKDLMDKYKTCMLQGLIDYPSEFVEYSNADLNLYEILVAYADMMKNVYEQLDIGEYFILPKLTIGATVADLLAARIFKWRGLSPEVYHSKEKKSLVRKKILKNLMGKASSDYLRTQLVRSYLYLQGKIHGGRCHNNNPLMRYKQDAIADYDIAGAYSSVMQNISFFIGTPFVYDNVENEITLGDFLRYHEYDFDDNHYTIYVSTKEPLQYEQDFLVSWHSIGKLGKDKVSFINNDGKKEFIPVIDYQNGDCRIFKREVINTPITSDTVKWIRSLSKKSRDELLNKLIVKSAMGYKRTEKNKDWYSINLGELLVNPLKEKRAEYKRLYKETNDNRYNSMQELFKLIMNTAYGVLCSRFFVTSNVIVANQITQMIRLGMYLMEKGLNLYGSITDGCIGSLNHVVYPKFDYKVNLDKMVNIYQHNNKTLNQDYAIRLGALDNAKHIDLTWHDSGKLDMNNDKIFIPELTIHYSDKVVNIKGNNEVKAWIDDKSWNHLKMLFPDFDYLFNFLKIETKDVYDSAIYHGAANYYLVNPNHSGKPKTAMRGYTGKKNVAVGIEYNEFTQTFMRLKDYDDSSIPEVFLKELKKPVVNKVANFIKTKILKTKEFVLKDYANRSELICGDEIIETGIPNFCSLSQFTFQDLAQYKKWKEAFTRQRNHFTESFEPFFTNIKGELDYDCMIKTLDKMVNDGCKNSLATLRKINPIGKKPSNRHKTKLEASLVRNALTFTITPDIEETENENSDIADY